MNFLAPFGFAFAAAIPVVIVFYLLKRKRQVRLVSSTLLWQKFLAETQASAPFQRLRHNWRMSSQLWRNRWKGALACVSARNFCQSRGLDTRRTWRLRLSR